MRLIHRPSKHDPWWTMGWGHLIVSTRGPAFSIYPCLGFKCCLTFGTWGNFGLDIEVLGFELEIGWHLRNNGWYDESWEATDTSGRRTDMKEKK